MYANNFSGEYGVWSHDIFYMKTISHEIHIYVSAIALDALLPRTARRRILRFLAGTELVLGSILIGFVLYYSMRAGNFDTSVVLNEARFFTAGFLILLGPCMVLLQLTFFYNTLYFRGLPSILSEDFVDGEGVTMEVAQIGISHPTDMTHGFMASPYGREVLFRLGITASEVDAFVSQTRARISFDSLDIRAHYFLTLQDVGEFLLERDEALTSFLFAHGITKDLFLGANEWVSRVRLLHKNHIRWWSRDNLGKIKGVGREFSFGVAYELQHFTRDINTTSALSLFVHDAAYANEVIQKMETVLARTKSANVILVGDPGVGEMDMLIEMGRRMKEGKSVESLIAKRLIVFDAEAFVATYSTKEEFERAFIRLMSHAERAGNIIVVIERMHAFIESVGHLGADVSELFGRFLTSSQVQIITTVDHDHYHRSLETNHNLLQHFETITIENPDILSTVRVLEEVVWGYEHTHHVFFTYPALMRVAESADRYLVDGVMPDKAVSFLAEVAGKAEQFGVTLILDSFVDQCVQEKTGIPSGPVDAQERDLLMHLEEVLHERVIGQHDAITAIAGAMRRARAGIQSKERPMSSFLFLGSTGVGKTETVKALAYTFFGSEDSMIRFDMSEYSGIDALERLIGTQSGAGRLSSALHEHPYSVLLLDELEKASEDVHDLFLQILDEGVFTDARGAHINARNTIIIATSNAGSETIRALVSAGKNLKHEHDMVVHSIIEQRIFKPEFINRFDAVVLFDILSMDEQRRIAQLMLRELQERIRERGYELSVDDALVDVVMRYGFDPQFGARSIRRAVQDILEERIARKIIEQGIRRGQTISFVPSDFDDVIGDTNRGD